MKDKSKKNKQHDPQYSHVEIEFDLAPGDRIQLTVEAQPGDGGVQIHHEALPAITAEPPQADSHTPMPNDGMAAQIQPAPKAAAWPGAVALWWGKLRSRKPVFDARFLFGIAMFIYFLTRFINLPDFPISFFSDEANNTMHAAGLVANGGFGGEGDFLPAYFPNNTQFPVSLSVYTQLPGYLLFGKSVWATRGSFALITLLAALWLSWTLRDIFTSRYWWSAPLFLAVVPGWFIHSRAAFEVSLLVTFFTGFIYYYLRYRTQKPRAIFAAIICGALAFYAYIPGQVIIVALGVMLVISDARYHWQQRKTLLWGLLVLLVMAIPFIRFLSGHPSSYTDQLTLYGSFWVQDIPFTQKLGFYLTNYIQALNPAYLFFYNTQDFVRFRMLGYGYIGWPLLPLLLGGLYLVVRNFRSSPWRVLLFALLASPLGVAMLGINASGVQTTIIPVILLGMLALGTLIDTLLKPRPRWQTTVNYSLMVFLLVNSISMTSDALINGPTWFHDYGRDGMQWGGEQVFHGAQAYLEDNLVDKVVISPNWSFQTEVLRSFFISPGQPITLGGVDQYLQQVVADAGSTLLVLSPENYKQVIDSGKFRDIKVEKVIPYPDGTDGYYFIRLAYRADIQAILEMEKESRSLPEETTIRLLDQDVVITHTKLDGMPIENIFDGNTETLIKTAEINPMVIRVDFSQPVAMSGLRGRMGAEAVRLTAVITLLDGSEKTYSLERDASDGNKDMQLGFGGTQLIKAIRIVVFDNYVGEKSMVHLWEITFIQ
jgi:hypothetical protein